MDSCKKTNSNWILCPSKSIPGKFYYFNVVTGEAVWGLDDEQTNALKKDNNIPKMADKSHTYPEPQIHKTFEEFSSASNFYSNNGYLYQQTQSKTCPRYGQAVFPQYFSNVTPLLMPSIIWTPIQMPVSMTKEKNVLDRNTQTADIESNFSVQTCTMPLSKRFTLLSNSKNVDTFGNSNGKIATSSPMCTKNWWNKSSVLKENTQLTDQTQQQNKKKLEQSNIIREPKLNCQKPTVKHTVSSQNIKPNKVNNESNMDCEEEREQVEDNLLRKLDKNDLRYLLVSKRRKSVDLGVLHNDKIKEEKESNNSHNVSPKKKVTFNLNTSDNGSNISIVNSDDTPIKKSLPIKFLRDLGKIVDPNTTWYIVVDRDILLDDIDFIMEYIEGDEYCKLLVSVSILKNIQLLGIGDGKRSIVLNARQVYRRLTNTSNKVHTVDIKEGASMPDDVINCCLQAIDENLHVTKDDCEPFVINNNDILSDLNDNICDDRNNDNDTIDMIAINKNILELDLNSSKDIKRVNKNNKSDNKNIHTDTEKSYRKDIDKYIDTAKDNKKYIHMNEKKIEENINCSDAKANETRSFKPLVFQKIFFNSQDVLNNKPALINVEDKTTDNQERRDSIKKDVVNKNDVITPKTLNKSLRNEGKENGGIHDWKNIVLTIDNDSNNRTATDNKCRIEDKLKSFYIKDKVTEQNIITRMEEYSCCYIQIMEEFLNIVLKKNKFVQKILPCSFHEGLECLKEFYFDVKIKKIIEELLSLWKKEDKIKMDIKPSVLMRVIWRGWLLVDSLKNTIPYDVKEIEYMFTKLMENMENPITEDVELIQTPIRKSQDQIVRSNYIKDESEIIEYLKKNFANWKNYEITKPDKDIKNIGYNDDVHIIRTSGKHLNRYKIDNKKQITFNNICDKDNNKEPQNGQTDLNIPVLHENTFDANNKDGPKVIRNVKPIDEFEKRITNKQSNLDDLKYSGIVEIISTATDKNDRSNNNNYYKNDNDNLNNNNNLKINDNCSKENDYQNNDDYSFDERNNNDTPDSGFENESIHTCTFIRNFLIDLSSSFKLIYTFIHKCHDEFLGGVMEETDKKSLYEKAEQTHTQMNAIIDKLKSIIERESAESTKLKLLLVKAGLDVTEDKRIARYRQTVTKCLEQAQILNCSLKLILSTNKDDVTDDMSLISYNLLSYFNIFE
ncbi:unnamed protein product, partial [Brenthis ino]